MQNGALLPCKTSKRLTHLPVRIQKLPCLHGSAISPLSTLLKILLDTVENTTNVIVSIVCCNSVVGPSVSKNVDMFGRTVKKDVIMDEEFR